MTNMEVKTSYKDVADGQMDGWMDGRTCHSGIGSVCINARLHAKVHFFVLLLVIIVD
jgi:hypothetical protein